MRFGSIVAGVSSVLGVVDLASAGPLTLQLKARTVPSRSVKRPRVNKPTDIALVDWIQGPADLQWYSAISVGTPPQNFTVLFDTGSNDLILPRNNCTTCGNHSLFDPAASKTFSPAPGLPVEVTFGTGGNTIPFAVYESVFGSVVTDAVTLAGLTVPAQAFLLCDVYAQALVDQPMDGIFGMGPIGADELSANVTPWYWQYYASGQLPSPEFSFYIVPGHEHGAELTIGGTDPTKYVGDITTVGLDTELSQTYGTWAVDLPFITVDAFPLMNGSRMATPGVAILDTGTAFIMGPDNETIASLYKQVSSSIVPIDDAGTWGGPCALVDHVAVDFTFRLGDATAGPTFEGTVPRAFFNLGEYPGLPGICQTLFVSPLSASVDPISGAPLWLIGSPLLKMYYTVWNGVALTIGFARAKTGLD